jgi:rare lipoprotein A
MKKIILFFLLLPGLLFSAEIPKFEIGIASYYAHDYHGRPTSSMEIFDMNQLTAAHRTLPFGTIVEVENLENLQRIKVRINDRGPFVGARILDLSLEAARQIGMVEAGVVLVRLTIVKIPGKDEAIGKPGKGD